MPSPKLNSPGKYDREIATRTSLLGAAIVAAVSPSLPFAVSDDVKLIAGSLIGAAIGALWDRVVYLIKSKTQVDLNDR